MKRAGSARSTDFTRLLQDFGEQEQDYLRRTRAFVDDDVLPVIKGL